ncbi:MAG: chorismate-binding protein [Myxococcales bacterium]|nr:chorismate-binding protein [Myxococcales bacterium]
MGSNPRTAIHGARAIIHHPEKAAFVLAASPWADAPADGPDAGSTGGAVIPVYREVVTDLLTPLSAFLRVDRDPSEPAYLLESVEGGEKWGRYSFIGIAPRELVRTRGHEVSITTKGREQRFRADDPLHVVTKRSARFTPVLAESHPRFFGGLVGYLGYDMVRFIEDLPERATRDLPIWDSALIDAGIVIALDSLRQRARVICPVQVTPGADPSALWEQARAAIDTVVARLRTPEAVPSPGIELDPLEVDPPVNVEGPEFQKMVERAREYIAAGDCIQVVLSRRFEIPTGRTKPFDLYRALRLTNPSPYMFFMRFPEYALVGASPELLVRRQGDVAEVRPIAGTRRRGSDPAHDVAIEAELRADPKEIAEHVMLVDLGRNDLGRIAIPGTVKVREQMVVERYSHVMHLVSQVEARLRPGTSTEDVIRATFPAGTLSGAPKVRAMQIIEELEPNGRGVYGGAAGYLGYGGNLDLAIAIRSVLAMPDRLYVQTGAGVVYDSDPARELEETREKARGVLTAIRLAREALGP